jgi:hypothetical protein
MPGGKRRILIGSLVAIAGIGFSTFVLARSAIKAPMTLRQADGTILTVLPASYGKEHYFVPTNGWRRLVGRWLPEQISEKLGVWVYSETNPIPSTQIMLMSDRSKSGASYQPFPYLSGGWADHLTSTANSGAGIEMEDDAGNSFLLSKFMVTRLVKTGTGSTYMGVGDVEAFGVPLVSHVAKRMILHVNQVNVYGKGGYQTTFEVANPASKIAPTWQAPPLPLTNSVNDLAVELLSIEPGAPRDFRLQMQLGHYSHGTRARLRVLQNGVPTTAWRATSVSVADEDGNVFRPQLIDYPGGDSIGFEGGFAPAETRKFKFGLTQVEFPPEDPAATTENIYAPGSPFMQFQGGVISPATRTLKADGYTLRMDGIRAASNAIFTVVIFNYQISPTPPPGSEPCLLLRTKGPDGGNVLLGRYRIVPYEWGTAPVCWMDLPNHVGTGGADLTFTVSTPRYVEFLAHPSPPSTNSPPAK